MKKRRTSLKDLNSLWWYRLLKVLFLGSLGVILLLGNTILSYENTETQITKESFERIGEKTKELYPTYKNIDSVELGKEVFKKSDNIGLQEWREKFYSLIEYETIWKQNWWQKHAIFNVITILLFFLFSKIFFYIYTGTFFPQKK